MCCLTQKTLAAANKAVLLGAQAARAPTPTLTDASIACVNKQLGEIAEERQFKARLNLRMSKKKWQKHASPNNMFRFRKWLLLRSQVAVCVWKQRRLHSWGVCSYSYWFIMHMFELLQR